MKSLYGKFVVTTVIIMVVSAILGFLMVNTYYHRVLKDQNDEKNVMIAKAIATHIQKQPNIDIKNFLETTATTGYQLYVVSETGTSQFYGGEFRQTTLPESTVTQVLNGQVYHGMRDFPRETFMTGFFANELTNTIGVPFEYQGQKHALFIRPNIKLLFNEIHTLLGGLFISMTVISLFAMLVVAKKLIDPITALTDATKRIAHETYDVPLAIDRNDEIGQLANSFNNMMTQLRANDQLRKEFISNVSHDFQSPLLNIQGYADLLGKEDLTHEEREQYSDIIQTETQRLSTLTKQLLLLTSLDQSSRVLKRRPFNLSVQLRACVQKYRWLLEERNITIEMQIQDVEFNGDEALFENVLENVITNAIKYNVPEGEIRFELSQDDKVVTLVIADTGIGMDEEEQGQLFERFYRADTSRSTEGTGLGLAIVKQIIDMHNGTIHVLSEKGKGSVFQITLPKL